jgi:hypothetical protein
MNLFDDVYVAMWIHPLGGTTIRQSVANVRRAIGEAFCVLRPGGRPIILEFSVPQWVYWVEGTVFPLDAALINAIRETRCAARVPPAR